MTVAALLGVLVPTAPALAAPADEIAPRPLPAPARTEWRPSGCRSVPFSDPVLPPRTAGAARRLRRLAAKVRRPPVRRPATTAARYHRKAAGALGRACRLLSR